MVAITQVLTLGSLIASAYATPAHICKQHKSDVSELAEAVPHASHFCDSYLNADKDTSVVHSFSPARLHRTCECVHSDSASSKIVGNTKSSGSLAGHAAASVCNNVQLAHLLSGIKDVTYFCQHFNPNMWGHSSPIFGATTQAIQQACQCVLNAATASVTKGVPPTTTKSTTQNVQPTQPSQPPQPSQPGSSGGQPWFGGSNPFHFCPTNTYQIYPFRAFCQTPLWKAWSCQCSTIAQVCFPNTKLSWCPAGPKSSSSVSPSASQSPFTSSTTTIPTTSPTTIAPSSAPTTSTTTIPTTTTTPAPVSSSTTDAPASSSSSTTTDTPVATTSSTDSSSTDSPVATPSTSTTDDGSGATTSVTTSDASAST